jgi:hypothetical protein
MMIIARLLLIALCCLPAALPAAAQSTWKLINPEEEARDNAAPRAPAPADLPPPPTITLVRPDISRPIQNPVTVEVQFGAGPGQTIDMSTFNATYGWLGINITQRLLEHAVKMPNSVSAANVELPAGEHRVTLSIADTSGKRASRTFSFNVSK